MASMTHSEPMHSSFHLMSHRDQFFPHHMPQQHHYQPITMRQHHHHRLPTQTRHESLPHLLQSSQPEMMGGTTSVVGQEGMPEPASRPRGPKLKFSAQEDQMLVDLKENKNLTWKQIADFFPGRTSGTLQVRYCTKLKAKTVIWTDDTVQRLRKAIDEYENDKWRLIAAKVGSGFSPTACQEKAEELEDQEELEEATTSESRPGSSTSLRHYASLSSQPTTSSAPMQSYTAMSSQPTTSAPMQAYASYATQTPSSSSMQPYRSLSS